MDNTLSINELIQLLDKEQAKGANALPYEYGYFVAIDLIRQLDIFYLSGENNILEERYRYGWLKPISLLMHKCAENDNPILTVTENESKYWSDSVIQVFGKIEISKRLILLSKALLIDIEKHSSNKFLVKYKNVLSNVEYIERENMEFVNKLLFKTKEEDYFKHIENADEIFKEISKIVLNPESKFISYFTTPEIDNYYRKLGYYHLIRVQGYSEFDEKDIFGGITFGRYLDVLENVIGNAIKHRDCCLTLLKSNPNVDPYNIFTYTWYEDETVKNYAEYHALTYEETKQIFSCLTLSLENLNYYENDIGNPPPPYFKLGKNQITRSITGCFDGGIQFLKKELKRRFIDDYFKAVNNREDRFRNDLYILFPQENFIKIDKSIVIKGEKYETDIDALIFDVNTQTLGLFQLKWQDPYTTSLKERFSRITNLFPKSIEWINKIEKWLSTNDYKNQIEKLGLSKNNQIHTIKDVCLFIISRHNMFFTGQTLDNRAAWSSLHGLVHTKTRFKSYMNNPILELYISLKLDSPEIRSKREDHPKIASYKIEFQDFSIEYND